MTARYLLRFDDVCPTMNWGSWDAVEELLVRYGIRPLIAVIPDNTDAKMLIGPPNPSFWERVRSWQGRGWSIGLHGYHHTYVTAATGFGPHPGTEFAGLSFQEQDAKIRDGLAVFEREGLRADAWIAPNHSFDPTTLSALRERGVTVVSDGDALFPYRDATGMVWVPMQLWSLRDRPWGVWTVCLHHNGWTSERVDAFSRDLRAFHDRITDLPTILERYGSRPHGMIDVAFDRQRRMRRRIGFPHSAHRPTERSAPAGTTPGSSEET